MEYYNNILCITSKELIISKTNPNGVVSENNFKNWIRRGKIKNINGYACYGFAARYAFNDIPLEYREMWKAKNGDPEKKANENVFVENYEWDESAADFYKKHTFGYDDNEKTLSDERQREYTYNASVFNAIGKTLENNRSSRKSLMIPKITGFWKLAAEALTHFSEEGILHTLPYNYRRLQDRYNKYQHGGYTALIHSNYQNISSVKITDEGGEWILAQWMSQIERVTLEQLFARYNVKADGAGWKKLKSSVSIRAYLERPEIKRIWYAARYGELSSKEKYSRQNRTLLPTRRDSLWYSDGTKLNYFYRDELGNVHTCNVYEVMDVYSECFLGYHISKSENFEAQYYSYKMAIETAGCKPYEIRYDGQGGHKKLQNSDLLMNLARLSIKTTPYNGKSKTIESAFGRFQADYLHKDWFFTGQNITAKKQESRANMEFILANTDKLPTLEEIKETYKKRRDEWNADPHHKTGISRKEMYRTSENDKAKKVDMLDMIDMFGITTKDARQYTASGIELQIKDKKYAFEVLTADNEPDMDFNRRNIGRKFYRRYQPDDMSMVALYEKDATGMRFIALAQSYQTVHRAIQDQTDEDVVRIRRTQILNKEQRISDEVQRSEILKKHNLHPNQHGLNVPPIKGVTSGKKQKKDVGQMLKDVSNMTDMDTEKERRKAARDAAKKDMKEAEKWEDNYRDYLRRKKELEIISVN